MVKNTLQVKIIKVLLEKQGKQNVSTIASSLKTDYKNVYKAIENLENQGVVSIEKFGKSNVIILNKSISPLLYKTEYIRREELGKNLRLVKDYFDKNLSTKLYVMLLFGSYAKKTNSRNSDIDLLFIVPDNTNLEKEIDRVTSTIPFDVHSTVIKESNFIKMKNSREKTVVSESMKGSVILHGIEVYYEMIK